MVLIMAYSSLSPSLLFPPQLAISRSSKALLKTITIMFIFAVITHYETPHIKHGTFSAPALPEVNNQPSLHYQIAKPSAATAARFMIGFHAPSVAAAATDTCSGPLVVAVGLSAKVLVLPPGAVDVLVVTEVATPPPDTLMEMTPGLE
jgi:hypothetical protein